MPDNKDPDASLSDHNTLKRQAEANPEDPDTRSLGDQATLAGGRGKNNPKSLGDQATFGGASGDDDYLDDDMEVVDLETRYKIEKTLGKGGMGEVLLATDTRLDRKVAIKRILGDAARSRTAVNRFLTEAKSIAALNHPNIVQIYDYGRAKDGPFLIMEFVDGNSLLDRCREGAIPLEEAIELACQLCDGLSIAHDAGIVHRDIKPANILFSRTGIPKLTDFGLAKAESADTGMTMAGVVLGTLDFMPPEQRRDAALTDARSDLWSLAATLYQMVTGESPKVIRLKKLPLQLQDVLDKALEESKDDRFQTASELQQALRLSFQTQVPKSTATSTADLGTGECPSCHVANESHRKFCRECSEPLRCKCLKCQHEIPVWDKVCPECGGKQADLINIRLGEIQKQVERAEQEKAEHKYESAIAMAESIAAIDDRRLNHQRAWANQFVESAKLELERRKTLSTLLGQIQSRQKELAKQYFAEAKKHRQAFDYDAAIDAIKSIPAAIRSAEMMKYLDTLVMEQQESLKLMNVIRSCIQSRHTASLVPKLNRYRRLRGTTPELQNLLEQLQCPQCNQVNEPGETKCKGCGSKLSAPCMQCQQPMPVWDLVCDKCGTSQSTLIDQKNQRLETQRQSAEQLLNQFEFEQASELAKELKSETDARLKSLSLRSWADEFLADVDRRRIECMGRITRLLGEAISLEKEFDYAAAIEKLRQVPPRYMADPVPEHRISPNQLLVRNQQTIEECKRLQDLISSRVATQQLNGLLPEVEKLLQLQPRRSDTKQLKAQLIERDRTLCKARDDAIARARKHLVEFDYARVLSELESIDEAYVNEEVLDLQQKATFNRDRGKQLRETIAARVKEKDLHGLLPQVLECLELMPNAEDLMKLRAQLELREHQNAQAVASILEKARSARLRCQFDAATALLQRIPRELVTIEIANVLQECQKLHSLQTDAMTELQHSIKTEKFAIGVRKSKAYLKSLKHAELTDSVFSQAYETCQFRAIELRRDLLAQLKIATVVLTGCLISAGVIATLIYSQTEREPFPKEVIEKQEANRIVAEKAKAEADRMAAAKAEADRVVAEPPLINSINLALRKIPAGKFLMGEGSESREVILTEPFYIGVYEVTQEQFQRVTGTNLSRFKGPSNPVENVSWEDALKFCTRLSELPEEKKAGRVYRLPTEAEWEYACRAGTTTNYSFGDDESSFDKYGWFKLNSNDTTHAVGQKKPNTWGLYDMHGNAWEWCSDWYGEYPKGQVVEPIGPIEGANGVVRGGSWYDSATPCRSAFRGEWHRSIRNHLTSFRVVMSLTETNSLSQNPSDSTRSTAPAEASAAWHKGIASTREALDRADFETFEREIARGLETAQTPAEREQAARLDQLGQLYKIGTESFEEAKSKLKGISSLRMGPSEISIVETTSEKLVIRVSGKNQAHPWDKLPAGIAIAMLDLTLDSDAPTDVAARAVFFSLAPQFREAATKNDSLKKRIAGWFEKSLGKDTIRVDLPQALTDFFE